MSHVAKDSASNSDVSSVKRVLGKYLIFDGFNIVPDYEKSQGSYLYDALSNTHFLDCLTHYGSLPIGYNHPMMADVGFQERLRQAANIKPANSDLYPLAMARFVETFARVALPASFRHLFFVDGGTLAVENALKAAFDWKVQLNFAIGANCCTNTVMGQQVMHFRESFHGRSGYCLSLTDSPDPRKTRHFPVFEWPRITNPKMQFPIDRANTESVIEAEELAEWEMRAAFQRCNGDIAALIIEPIQGEGGDNHFRPEFHRKLRDLADEFEVLLIYDEVQTGLGITGKMWAYEHYYPDCHTNGGGPDIISFGKKMQVCGMMSNSRIDRFADNVFSESSRIDSTWGGALVDMVRAERYLEIIEQEQLVSNACEMGNLFLRMLEELRETYTGHSTGHSNQCLITNIRGKGLLCAFDLPTTVIRNDLLRACFAEGLLLVGCGKNSIRFRPALTFSEADIEDAKQRLTRALSRISSHIGL